MPRTLHVAILLTVLLGHTGVCLAQPRIEVDPLLINDLKGKPNSSLKLLEVEFRVITLDLGRVRTSDMDRIRGLFGLTKSAIPNRSSLAYPSSSAQRKLSPVKADGPIKHQVLETKPFQDLLSWMSARHIASNAGQSGRKIALGSTVVVLDQRVSAPRLTSKKDPRTGTDVHSVDFVLSGLHLELTPVSQVHPKEKEGNLAAVWQLQLDRVLTSLINDNDKSESKLDRARKLVTLAVGQTALIPNFVKTDRPAFVLLSVKAPKPKPTKGEVLITSTGEVIRLSTEPGGPGLADRITQTLVPPTGTPKPRLYKPGETKATLKRPVTVVAETPARASPRSGPPKATQENPGVIHRVIKESEIPLRQGVRVLDVYENETVKLLFPDGVSTVRTSGDKESLLTVTALEPDSLLIQAGEKGVGSLNVESGKNAAGTRSTFHIEIIVRGDTRLLARTLDKLFPDDTLELTEINDAIVIRGKVSRAAVAKQIVEIAEQFYPRVLDQMQPRAGEAPANGEESPAIGTEIRELRTDVKSLRDEIRKLIKVMEQQTNEESSNETSLRDLNTPRDKADAGKAGDIRVAIMCRSGKPVSTKHPTLAKDLSDFISSILKDRAIETASRQQIEKWQATNPFRSSPTEIGRGAGATHVLLIDVADYGLYEKQSDDLFRGHMNATVSVLDTARTDKPQLLTETLNSRFPIAVGRSVSDITEAEFRGDFNTRLAFEVARVFSDAQSEFAVAR